MRVTQKASAAKCGDVGMMLWIDCESYFGPDRRRKPAGMRLRERRRYNCAGNPPPLNTALRQLRMRILDARGPAAAAFANRARAVASLAASQGEHDAAQRLSTLAVVASRGLNGDVRSQLYQELDRVHAVLRDP
jgi:hypothetical protein